MPNSRQSWDEYFLALASQAATRSNCSRRKVGAVIVQGRHIRSTGYNGPPAGYGHCDAGACPRALTDPVANFGRVRAAAEHPLVGGDLRVRAGAEHPLVGGDLYDNCVAIHAEANALLFADHGDRDGSSLYSSAAPCFSCAKLIANSGIAEVVAGGGRYDGWEATRNFLQDCKVRVRVLDGLEHAVQLPLRG
ncbi:MAG: dCMP deaminase family protein [Actinomycetota bacterium]|jgi:dCMP deaminase|nr:dCMP deaminase family protein [Euzebyaceae bacterium]MDQ3451838.1 dCMP deaminase family protein [Actinomycetota bacterium]